jgi:hypothetical protein
MLTRDHLLVPRQQGVHHHLQVQDTLLGGAKGHGGGGHQHLHRDVLPHQQQLQQHLPNKQHLKETMGGRPPGGLRAVGHAYTTISKRRPNEHGFAHGDNWLIKPGMAHPPSTVWNLQHHPDHLLPSLGGRDLSDGSAAPPSSPLLRAPGKKKEDENI